MDKKKSIPQMTTAIKPWRIIDLINWGTDHFNKIGITNARREMEWLLCETLGYERIDLYLKFAHHIEKGPLGKLRTMVKRRGSGEPFQHIIGKAPFYGRDFIVNSHVLVPRSETGTLIDRLKKNGAVLTLLDVGTGSGCIAITCALEDLAEKIYAIDISPQALEIARINMQLHNMNHIKVACHDFLNKNFKTKFDVVISNPPYVRVDEMDGLQIEVRDYDPKIALTDGADGLIFYKRFAEKFDDLIKPGGFMLLEIGGKEHKDGVENIFSNAELQTTYLKDFQGDFRTVEVRK